MSETKMAAVQLLLVALCCLTLQLHVTAAAECRYQVPSTRGAGLCETYDLSKLAALGPFTVNGSSDHADGKGEAKQAVYYLSLCGDVPKDFLPKECANVEGSPAYQFTEGEACVALGDLSDVVAVSTRTHTDCNEQACQSTFLCQRRVPQWLWRAVSSPSFPM